MLNWLALKCLVNHSDTRGQVQCTVSWCIMRLHQENEARLKMFMNVQINLLELTEFEVPQASNQENQVY